MDTGTRLLLKHLAGLSIPPGARVLDVGCGTGIIGCCLKKHYPGLSVVFQDRDALALAFTGLNLKENGLEPEDVRSGFLLPGAEEKPFDLIVSNLPAKAGLPVLDDFFLRCPGALGQGGTAAVVIVEPLSKTARESIQAGGSEIITEEHTPGHSVYIFRRGPAYRETPDPGPEIYIRNSDRYTLGGCPYDLDTVYGLPGFDNPGYTDDIVAGILPRSSAGGPVIFFNPGQGHVPCAWIAGDLDNRREIVLAGRDALSLTVTARNISKFGVTPRIHHIPSILRLPEYPGAGRPAGLIAFPDFIQGTEEQRMLMGTAARLIKPGGFLLVAGKSSDLSRFRGIPSPFTLRTSKKYRGFRGLLYLRQSI